MKCQNSAGPGPAPPEQDLLRNSSTNVYTRFFQIYALYITIIEQGKRATERNVGADRVEMKKSTQRSEGGQGQRGNKGYRTSALRQASRLGVSPKALSSLTLCCVGFVF